MKSTMGVVVLMAASIGLEMPAQADSELNWMLFSNVNFAADNQDGSKPAFAVGGVDYFVTASWSENVRLLSESVLEILGEEVVFDLERISFEYDLGPVTLGAGRWHSPIGYYFSAFHHALLFVLPTSRPMLVGWEDEGGILPAHLIGVRLDGTLSLGGESQLKYALGVGNGRGQFADDIMAVFDRNASKAVVAQVRVTAPLNISGAELGLSGYYDTIPSGFTNEMGMVLIPENLTEIVASVHAVYRRAPIELIAEGHYVHHIGTDSNDATKLFGGFVDVGYSVGGFTPYGRFELIDRDAEDPFFTASGAPEKARDVRVGVRYQIDAKAVWKAELGRELETKINRGTAQVAFAF